MPRASQFHHLSNSKSRFIDYYIDFDPWKGRRRDIMWWLLYWHEVTGPMRCTWCSSSQTIYYLHQTAIPLPPIPLRKERREGARPAILDTPRHRTKGMAMHLPPHYILNTLFPTPPTPSSFFLSSPPYFAFYHRNNFILSSCSHSCPWLFRSDLLFFFFFFSS